MKLDENDYLNYQLYTASKTPRIKKARIKSWVLATVSFLCLSFLFFRSDNHTVGYYFLIVSGLSLVFFPLYSRWRYKRHFLAYTRDAFKNRYDEEVTLDISAEVIRTKDKTSEVIINTSEIEEINEIKEYCFVKIKTGQSLIISKSKTENFEEIKGILQNIANTKGIKYNLDLDWKWR
jgi:hypothetical protein